MTRFLAFVAASRWGLVFLGARVKARADEEGEVCWERVVVERGGGCCGGRRGRGREVEMGIVFGDVRCDWERWWVL